MAKVYDALVPIKGSEYGYAFSFIPKGGVYGEAAARAILAGLQEMAFSGRCEYYTWESARGDLYVVSLALKDRVGKAMPSYDWWKTLARVVASRTPNDEAALDIGCSELASVESMRRNCLPCGAVEFLDGRPLATLDQVDSWFTCECSAIVAASSNQSN